MSLISVVDTFQDKYIHIYIYWVTSEKKQDVNREESRVEKE